MYGTIYLVVPVRLAGSTERDEGEAKIREDLPAGIWMALQGQNNQRVDTIFLCVFADNNFSYNGKEQFVIKVSWTGMEVRYLHWRELM